MKDCTYLWAVGIYAARAEETWPVSLFMAAVWCVSSLQLVFAILYFFVVVVSSCCYYRWILIETPTNMDRKQVVVLDCVGPGKYQDAKLCGVLPGKGRDFRIHTNGLMRLTAHNAFNLQEYRLGPLREL